MNKRLDLINDFKSYLEESSRVVYGSCGTNTNYKERCDVHFFEWSDLDSVPKRFSNSKEFFKFLEDCKIDISDGLKKHFDDRYTFYATCFKGSNVLCLASSKVFLENLVKKAVDAKTIPTSDFDRCSFYSSGSYQGSNHNYRPYGGHYGYGCGCYDGFDDWD